MNLARESPRLEGGMVLRRLGWFALPLLTRAAILWAVPAALTASDLWTGPDGRPLPFSGDQQVLDYLRTARIVSMEPIPQGTSGAEKVLLEKGKVRAHAVFRTMRRKFDRPTAVNGVIRLHFRDDFVFEKAAYELSVLLGLRCVPPTVLRIIDGREGSLQLWIERAITETERRGQRLMPLNDIAWTQQLQTKMLFDRLIGNTDRNLGNQLIDRHWKLWLIDHTRSFVYSWELRSPKGVYWCSRPLWRRLNELEHHQVKKRLRPYLGGRELGSLFKRWDKLLDHVGSLIEEKGEKAVLF